MMMSTFELTLERFRFSETATIGHLTADGIWQCYTLEDRVRDGVKVPGKTAIPPGRYRVEITHSNRFKCLMPLLIDVPGFTGIRIHPGNTHEDTDGCILVGMSCAGLTISKSRLAYDELFGVIQHALSVRHEQVWITVT